MRTKERISQPVCRCLRTLPSDRTVKTSRPERRASWLPVGCPMQMSWKRDSADIGCERMPSSMYLEGVPHVGIGSRSSQQRKKSCLEVPRAWRRCTSCTQESLNALRTLMPQWQRSKAETKNTVRALGQEEDLEARLAREKTKLSDLTNKPLVVEQREQQADTHAAEPWCSGECSMVF